MDSQIEQSNDSDCVKYQYDPNHYLVSGSFSTFYKCYLDGEDGQRFTLQVSCEVARNLNNLLIFATKFRESGTKILTLTITVNPYKNKWKY